MIEIDKYELDWISIAQNREIPIHDRLEMIRSECVKNSKKCITALSQFIDTYELQVKQTNPLIRPSKEDVESLKQLFKRRFFLGTQIIYSIPSSTPELLDTDSLSCPIVPSSSKEKIRYLLEEQYRASMEKHYADERLYEEEKLRQGLFCALGTSDFGKLNKILKYIRPETNVKRFGELYSELIEEPGNFPRLNLYR